MFEMINFKAIAICTLFCLVLGFLRYARIFFGKSWMKAVGIKQKDLKPQDAIKGFLITFIAAFVQSLILALLIVNTGTRGIVQGICIGTAVGAGLVATTLFTNDAYENRPLSLSLINSGYRIVCFIVIGAILGAWQ